MRTAEDIMLNRPWIEEGVLHYIFEPNSILTLASAKELVKERLKITGEMDFPLYIDIRGVVSVEVEAREFLSSPQGTQKVIAGAIHVDNPMSKFFANLFISVNKPLKPTRMFTDKQKALLWLKKQSKSFQG